MEIYKKMFAVLFVLAAVNLCLAKPKWTWLQDENADGLNVETRLREHRGVELDGLRDEAEQNCKSSSVRHCRKRMLRN
jgi:hypothetical protein